MNLVQEKITEILKDGGMNDKHKKTELIEILKKACPKTENSKEFAKGKFEDWVENYYNNQVSNIRLLEERKLVLKNLWNEEEEEDTFNEDMKRWKFIMNDVVNEIETS